MIEKYTSRVKNDCCFDLRKQRLVNLLVCLKDGLMLKLKESGYDVFESISKKKLGIERSLFVVRIDLINQIEWNVNRVEVENSIRGRSSKEIKMRTTPGHRQPTEIFEL